MKTWKAKVRKFIAQLPKGTPIVEIIPYTDEADASIVLGGEYDGVDIQIGDGYYGVSCMKTDGTFIHLDGRGDLMAEIKRVMSA